SRCATGCAKATWSWPMPAALCATATRSNPSSPTPLARGNADAGHSDAGSTAQTLVEWAVRQIRPLLRRADRAPAGPERRARNLVHVPRHHGPADQGAVGKGGIDGASDRAVRVRDRTSDQLGHTVVLPHPRARAARLH